MSIHSPSLVALIASVEKIKRDFAWIAPFLDSVRRFLGDSKRRAYFEERFKHLGRTSLFAT
jgi:hypothetical protein